MLINVKNKTIYIDFENKLVEDSYLYVGYPLSLLNENSTSHLNEYSTCHLNEYDKIFMWRNVNNTMINITNCNKNTHLCITVYPTLSKTPIVELSKNCIIDSIIRTYKNENAEWRK